MRNTSETKLMDAFLQIHEGTLIGMVVGVLVMLAIALLLYGFGRCWCAKIHQLCGGATENNSDEIDRAEKGKRDSKVTMIK